MEDKRHKNKGPPHDLILKNNDIIDQTVELFQKNIGIFALRGVLQKLNVREIETSC